MEKLLIKLIMMAAVLQLARNGVQLQDCHSRQCLQNIERASRDVLKIKWKPISIFPEQAKMFR